METKSILESKIERMLANLLADKCMQLLDDAYEERRLAELKEYVEKGNLDFDNIEICLYEYAFRIYIRYIGEAEYRYSKLRNPWLALVKGFAYKIQGKSFGDAFGEERNKFYRAATAKINCYLFKVINLLLDEKFVTQEQGLILGDTFLKETHVWYTLMPISIGNAKRSFIEVLRQLDKNEINKHFSEKYGNETLLGKPCKGYYKNIMKIINNDAKILFMEYFYETENKLL